MGRPFGKIIIFIVIFLVIMVAVLYFSFDHVLIYVLSKAYNLNFSYSSLKMESFNHYILEDLNIINKKMGLGLFSRYADIKLTWNRLPFKNMITDFSLKEVNFLKEEPVGKAVCYDSICELVSVPFDSNWTYKEISGKIQPFEDGINIMDFMAVSDEIKLSFRGTIFYTQTLNIDAVIYFSDKLVGKIPKELSTVILQNEDNGWKSLSVKLTGDYKAPSIQVTSKLFRLSVQYETEKVGQD
jgi:hypothetical protein